MASEIINQAFSQALQLNDSLVLSLRPGPGTYESQVLNNAVADALLSIQAVDTVYVDQSTESIRVWTIVDDPAEYVYDQIYDAEKSIIHRFQGVRFDFLVVPRKGRETRSLITLNCPGWTRYVELPKFNHAGS